MNLCLLTNFSENILPIKIVIKMTYTSFGRSVFDFFKYSTFNLTVLLMYVGATKNMIGKFITNYTNLFLFDYKK